MTWIIAPVLVVTWALAIWVVVQRLGGRRKN